MPVSSQVPTSFGHYVKPTFNWSRVELLGFPISEQELAAVREYVQSRVRKLSEDSDGKLFATKWISKRRKRSAAQDEQDKDKTGEAPATSAPPHAQPERLYPSPDPSTLANAPKPMGYDMEDRQQRFDSRQFRGVPPTPTPPPGFYSVDQTTGEIVLKPSRMIPWITNTSTMAAVDVLGLLLIGIMLAVFTFVSCSVLRWVFILRFRGSPMSCFHIATIRSWADYLFARRDLHLYDSLGLVFEKQLPRKYRMPDRDGNFLYFLREEEAHCLENEGVMEADLKLRCQGNSGRHPVHVQECEVPGYFDLATAEDRTLFAGRPPRAAAPTQLRPTATSRNLLGANNGPFSVQVETEVHREARRTETAPPDPFRSEKCLISRRFRPSGEKIRSKREVPFSSTTRQNKHPSKRRIAWREVAQVEDRRQEYLEFVGRMKRLRSAQAHNKIVIENRESKTPEFVSQRSRQQQQQYTYNNFSTTMPPITMTDDSQTTQPHFPTTMSYQTPLCQPDSGSSHGKNTDSAQTSVPGHVMLPYDGKQEQQQQQHGRVTADDLQLIEEYRRRSQKHAAGGTQQQQQQDVRFSPNGVDRSLTMRQFVKPAINEQQLKARPNVSNSNRSTRTSQKSGQDFSQPQIRPDHLLTPYPAVPAVKSRSYGIQTTARIPSSAPPSQRPHSPSSNHHPARPLHHHRDGKQYQSLPFIVDEDLVSNTGDEDGEAKGRSAGDGGVAKKNADFFRGPFLRPVIKSVAPPGVTPMTIEGGKKVMGFPPESVMHLGKDMYSIQSSAEGSRMGSYLASDDEQFHRDAEDGEIDSTRSTLRLKEAEFFENLLEADAAKAGKGKSSHVDKRNEESIVLVPDSQIYFKSIRDKIALFESAQETDEFLEEFPIADKRSGGVKWSPSNQDVEQGNEMTTSKPSTPHSMSVASMMNLYPESSSESSSDKEHKAVRTSTGMLERMDATPDGLPNKLSQTHLRHMRVFKEMNETRATTLVQCPSFPSIQMKRNDDEEVIVSVGTVYQFAEGPSLKTPVPELEEKYETPAYVISYNESAEYADQTGGEAKLKNFEGQAPTEMLLTADREFGGNVATGMLTVTDERGSVRYFRPDPAPSSRRTTGPDCEECDVVEGGTAMETAGGELLHSTGTEDEEPRTRQYSSHYFNVGGDPIRFEMMRDNLKEGVTNDRAPGSPKDSAMIVETNPVWKQALENRSENSEMKTVICERFGDALNDTKNTNTLRVTTEATETDAIPSDVATETMDGPTTTSTLFEDLSGKQKSIPSKIPKRRSLSRK